MTITPNTTLSRNTGIKYSVVNGEEIVMLNLRTGECYAFNSVATRIWELLERPTTVQQLCTRICEEFEIDMETCEVAILNFATEIVNHGIADPLETERPA